MRKYITLLIFISFFTNAMENDNYFFSSLMSYVSSFWDSFSKPKESQIIVKLRASRESFEKKIRIEGIGVCINRYKTRGELHDNCLNKVNMEISLLNIDCYPIGFLRYCYYQKFHRSDERFPTVSHMFQERPYWGNTGYNILIRERFKLCQSRIDGYSAISAAMIAPHTSLKQRRIFIRELFQYNFKPTLDDIQLAEFLVYEKIVSKKKETTFIHLLHDKPVAS